MNPAEINIPTIPTLHPEKPRDYPISPRENLMRALNCEKPLWMPNLDLDSQISPALAYGDMAPSMFEDSADWFGTQYKYSAVQGTSTPEKGVFNEIKEWREKVKWPDFDKWDWKQGYADFVRDESKALCIMYGYGIWEKLYVFEGFEQAFIDLALEPEECREFFERMADHKIGLFQRLNDVYHYDWVSYHDDYGTSHTQFFSVDMWKEIIFPPTLRIINALKDMGTKVIFHNCGHIEPFIPWLIDEFHSDGLWLQPQVNDFEKLVKTYGDRTAIYYQPDIFTMYDPDTTPDQARAYARHIVDTCGAHANPGPGAVMASYALREDVWHAFNDEIYEYSLNKYRGI